MHDRAPYRGVPLLLPVQQRSAARARSSRREALLRRPSTFAASASASMVCAALTSGSHSSGVAFGGSHAWVAKGGAIGDSGQTAERGTHEARALLSQASGWPAKGWAVLHGWVRARAVASEALLVPAAMPCHLAACRNRVRPRAARRRPARRARARAAPHCAAGAASRAPPCRAAAPPPRAGAPPRERRRRPRRRRAGAARCRRACSWAAAGTHTSRGSPPRGRRASPSAQARLPRASPHSRVPGRRSSSSWMAR